MGTDSSIQWTHHTANLWWGCEEVHAGCDHCYARVLARAKGKGAAWEGARFAGKGVWDSFRKWERDAERLGEVHHVFTGSMMDLFEKPLPASGWRGEEIGETTASLRERYFRQVVPATPHLRHLCLTKRPGNIPKMVPPEWLDSWPLNVMTGTSPADQATAETLLPQLLRAPGPHFLSVEPLLGPIDFSRWLGDPGLAWVIVGGESGPKSRGVDLGWIRSILIQCREAGVPAFVKQLGARPRGEWGPGEAPPVAKGGWWKLGDPKGGEMHEFPEDLRVRQFPDPIR